MDRFDIKIWTVNKYPGETPMGDVSYFGEVDMWRALFVI